MLLLPGKPLDVATGRYMSETSEGRSRPGEALIVILPVVVWRRGMAGRGGCVDPAMC